LQANVSNDPVAAARLRNALGSAMQRIDVNYDNVLTILASVGARLNELDAMDAIGAQRALGYGQQLSRLEDLDFYSASMQLQLKLSALEAASLAFQKIRATNLFNLNAN
jgi:flagellar hook-associated protein 3 FlgL